MSSRNRSTKQKAGTDALVRTILVAYVLVVGAAASMPAQTEPGVAEVVPLAHNSWRSGAPMPIAVRSAAAGLVGGRIYVVGGSTTGATVVYADNQIYDPATDAWSEGAALPLKRYDAASAVVNDIFYVISGTPNGTSLTKAVWAYNPKTNRWLRKAEIPTARAAAAAVVEKNIIYVIGGEDVNSNRLATVESYDPATNVWTEEKPLLVAKSKPAAGLLESTIVAAGGRDSSGDTGDNEGYNVTTDSWRSLAPDPAARDSACAGAIGGLLYVAGGYAGGGSGTPALSLTESFDLSKTPWVTLAPLPQAIQAPSSVVYDGQLYCFGGQEAQGGTVLSDVQIYQP